MKITNKICNKCNKSKNYIDFYRDKSRKDGLRNECKSCFDKKHLENKDRWFPRVKQYVLKRRQDRKKIAVEYMGKKCTICSGVFPSCVYDFHHTRDKDVPVGRLLAHSWEKLKKELDKCVLVCANCHRILSWNTD